MLPRCLRYIFGGKGCEGLSVELGRRSGTRTRSDNLTTMFIADIQAVELPKINRRCQQLDCYLG